jgi:extradiol dioxygenase family protein
LVAKRADRLRNGRITAYMDIKLWHTGPGMIIAAKTTTILSMAMKYRCRVSVVFTFNDATPSILLSGKSPQFSVFKILSDMGLALTVEQFHELADRVRKAGVKFIIEPHLRFEGMPGEQYTMFFKDPSGKMLSSFIYSRHFCEPKSYHVVCRTETDRLLCNHSRQAIISSSRR